jgi:hypothetical protein
LPDFEREDNWWNNGKNYYLENFEKWGFERVSEIKEHDVALIQIASPVPNHAAVIEAATSPHMLIHHLSRRLSCRQPYGGMLLKNTFCICRHKSLL